MDQVEALDEASFAAFSSLHSKIDDFGCRLHAVENCLGTISTAVCDTIPGLLAQLRTAQSVANPQQQTTSANTRRRRQQHQPNHTSQ